MKNSAYLLYKENQCQIWQKANLLSGFSMIQKVDLVTEDLYQILVSLGIDCVGVCFFDSLSGYQESVNEGTLIRTLDCKGKVFRSFLQNSEELLWLKELEKQSFQILFIEFFDQMIVRLMEKKFLGGFSLFFTMDGEFFQITHVPGKFFCKTSRKSPEFQELLVGHRMVQDQGYPLIMGDRDYHDNFLFWSGKIHPFSEVFHVHSKVDFFSAFFLQVAKTPWYELFFQGSLSFLIRASVAVWFFFLFLDQSVPQRNHTQYVMTSKPSVLEKQPVLSDLENPADRKIVDHRISVDLKDLGSEIRTLKNIYREKQEQEKIRELKKYRDSSLASSFRMKSYQNQCAILEFSNRELSQSIEVCQKDKLILLEETKTDICLSVSGEKGCWEKIQELSFRKENVELAENFENLVAKTK